MWCVCVCVCVYMCVSAVKERPADGAVHGGQIQCPVVSLAQHGSSHLLPDPHDHITWTDGHCSLHSVTLNNLSDLCVFLYNQTKPLSLCLFTQLN